MNTIRLQNDISAEQYQMAVRVLEAIGLKVQKDTELTETQKESILRGIAQAKNGQTKSHLEVREEARKICGM
ncbi:hypothetical protein [Capnocytophaga cynodegmi]|uniref:Uncharacterized protein n=1 Tax=Capnocytophaga cynodegmi TaxID=28189 RepID=A0A0B7HGS0_9FLAO|nr:hypothetical protein [Capnocytophaga cynodegmi]CEN36723.1 conserved hypothetical protein [Capnocytophaga cynodegmi]CEN42281.1 conserved hypothetical protein [Capnocytophaga cynodegmi]